MYNSKNKQYVFKQSTGSVWNFFSDERKGICYSILSKRNTWSEPVIVHKDFLPPFYIDMDFEDNFHVLFQDKQGNIFYTFLDKSNVKTVQVLKSNIPSVYNKYLQLTATRNNINIFFIVDHNNSHILAHQTISGKVINPPKVIDYIFKNEHPYSILTDKSGSIYVFYQVSDGKYIQIGFKKYTPSQKTWGEFTSVTRYNGDCQFPKAVIDNKDIISIVYQRKTEKNIELVYQQKVPERNMWSVETVIHSSSYSFNNSSIVLSNGNINVFWIRDDNINFSMSSDLGKSWGKPSKYSFPVSKQLLCFSFKSNNPYECDKVYAKEIPGSYLNGYRLAFYQEGSNNTSISTDELKSMIIDGMHLLKGNVEDLIESDNSIKDSISRIDNMYKNIHKELIKQSVKISYLEGEIAKLRNNVKVTESPSNHDNLENPENEDE
ncbi:MAG TPA: hypothetical protein VIO64_05545 [Pseudobacteroides sp.]|uniref:hypothetical protein n=1 Tax=Pseudobacteroides sp. TaxID=1968840 RepID=UPI002F93D8ED